MFLRAFIGIVVTIALALLLGLTKTFKHPATYIYSWLVAIAVLILIRWWM